MPQDNLKVVHPRLMVQYARRGVLYASEDHLVLSSADGGVSWQTVCVLENRHDSLTGAAKNALLRWGPIRALRRNLGIHNVVVLPSGSVIIQYDGIYRYDGNGSCARHVFRFSDANLYGPLKNGMAVDERTGHIYFGEYNNQRPYSVRIVRGRDDGRTWEVCYQFPAGAVKHVHSLVSDPYRNRLWILTGDSDAESHLFYTDDDFQSVHRYAGDAQTWRMVSLIPTPEALIWGSDAGRDAPVAQNHIYRLDLASGSLDRLAYINKPAYYTTRLKDGTLVLGTTYEPGQNGVEEASADIWTSADGADWQRTAVLPFAASGRDNGTRYATVNLALGDGSLGELFCTPVNVRDYDFRLLAVRGPHSAAGGRP